MKTVQDLDLTYVCTGCGTCEVVCPANAIKIKTKEGQYFPEIDMGKCIHCSRCIHICPGREENNRTSLKTCFPNSIYDKSIGYYQATYIGYSIDKEIRFKAASGGITTTVLLYLLENQWIDGAIVTKQDPKNPLKNLSFVARTKEDILESVGSKYSPTHTVSAIKEIKDKPGQYAFVGLPCQIRAIRKLQEKYSWVKEKIVLTIGLFCSRGVTYKGTEFVVDKFARGTRKIKSIKYRGDGWPGGYRISYANKKYTIAHKDYWDPYFANYFFTPYRCLVCGDLFSEGADISLGDAWLPEIKKKDSIGTSIIISRSKIAEEILLKLKEENILHLNICPKKAVIISQKGIIKRKINALYARRILFKLLRRPVPKEDKDNKDSYAVKDFIMAAMMLFNAAFSKSRLGQKILLRVPKDVLLKYRNILHKL